MIAAPKGTRKESILVDPRAHPEPKLHQVISNEGQLTGEMPAVDEETLLRLYRFMLIIRLLDERMMILQRQGRIGFYGACTGQEAPPIGTAVSRPSTA